MSKAEGPFYLAAFGVIPGVLSFVAVPLAINGVAVFPLVILVLSLLIGLGGASYLAIKFKDSAGLTWYGSYGETVGGFFTWHWLYATLIAFVIISGMSHFPGIGDHRMPVDSPKTQWVLTGECKDGWLAKDGSSLCTEEVCKKTREGTDGDWSKEMCEEHAELKCGGGLGRSAFDFFIEYCPGTCECDKNEDIFNFKWQTSDEFKFPCEDAGLCPTRRLATSGTWLHGKHPRWLEGHVVFGMITIILAPFQFLKSVRTWNNFAFHKVNGYLAVISFIPCQISAMVIAVIGLTDERLTVHWYTAPFRVLLIILFVFSLFFVSMAMYHIRRKNVEAHASYMMRAMGMWIVVPTFRLFQAFYMSFFSFRVVFVPATFTALVVSLIGVEVYLALSGRFVKPTWEEDQKEVGMAEQVEIAS